MAKKEIISEELEQSLLRAEKKMKGLEAGGDEDADNVVVKSSKPIAKIAKGDTIKVDSLVLEVDAHYVLIDHGTTKEMAIECFDPKKDKDYQIRYFSDRVENSIEFYELEEIVYVKRPVKKIEW
jgi:hypothetical protein